MLMNIICLLSIGENGYNIYIDANDIKHAILLAYILVVCLIGFGICPVSVLM